MADVKITKRMVLMAIADYVGNHDFEATVDGVVITADDVDAYVSTTLEQIDKKNAKAAERAAQKRAESDELRATIAGLLTDEYQTVAQIMDQLDVEDLTPAKIVSRLTQLRKSGEIHSTDMKVDGRKVKGYALGAAPQED